jgi:hypothetical protein
VLGVLSSIRLCSQGVRHLIVYALRLVSLLSPFLFTLLPVLSVLFVSPFRMSSGGFKSIAYVIIIILLTPSL